LELDSKTRRNTTLNAYNWRKARDNSQQGPSVFSEKKTTFHKSTSSGNHKNVNFHEPDSLFDASGDEGPDADEARVERLEFLEQRRLHDRNGGLEICRGWDEVFFFEICRGWDEVFFVFRIFQGT